MQPTKPEEIVKQIEKLAENRKAHQLLFISEIRPIAAIKLRMAIDDFKKRYSDVKEIDLILSSPGGSGDDAYRIIRTLRKNFETVNIIVPFWAKSAATLISLGASILVMDEFGELGPIDAQVGKVRDDSPQYEVESALNDEHSLNRIETRYKEMFESMYVRLFEHEKINITKHELSKQLFDNLAKFYAPLLSKIDPYKLGDKRRKLEIGEQYATRILFQYGQPIDRKSGRELVYYLVNSCPDHGYVIDFDLISKFLKNVVTSEQFGGKVYKQMLYELSNKIILLPSDFTKIEFLVFNENKENDSKTSTPKKQINATKQNSNKRRGVNKNTR